MLILQAKDVQPCSVIKAGENQTQKFPSLFYRGYLFIQIASYRQNQLALAIQQCRQSLEANNLITTIIVKTPNNITLWVNDRRLKIANTPNLPVLRLPQVINSLLPTKELFDLRQNLEFYKKWDQQSLDFWQEIARTQPHRKHN